MDQTNDTWSETQVFALKTTWGEYRTWAATARAQRSHIFSWRTYTLLLTTAGALLATLSQTISSLELGNQIPDSVPTILALLGGLAIGLATLFGREILRPEAQQNWARSRSMAEALKSETYLFRSGTPPYDTSEAAEFLNEKTEKLLNNVKDLQTIILSDEQKEERLPEGPLSVDKYIEDRIIEQITNYYEKRVVRYQKVTARGRNISLGLGVLAVILGVLGASGWTAGWIALITTITAALAAYLYAGRYQYLLVSFQATLRQLNLLKNRWAIIAGKPDTNSDKRNQFIMDCENVISVENSAWMSQLTDIN